MATIHALKPESSGISLTQQQQAALDTLLRFARGETDHAMAVLEGYAGTGKTTLVGRLLEAVMGDVGLIAVAAPTNKAVKVLREKIQEAGVGLPEGPIDPRDRDRRRSAVEFGSIHSFLGLQMSEREDGTQECRSTRDPTIDDYGLVIVDECSMLGTDLFHRIVVAKRSARVLFVGDPAQLPPIEPGENLSPTFERVALRVTLSEVVRQAADNPIIALSVMLRQAIETNRRVDPVAIAETLPPLPADAALVAGDANTIVSFALYEIAEQRDARVVAFTNAAVMAYNQRIHTALHGATAFPLAEGERAIVHSQHEAMETDAEGRPDGTKTTLVTSEEVTVRKILDQRHPIYSQVPASKLVLERDNGDTVSVFMPVDARAVDAAVSEQFAEWRRLKAEADQLGAVGRRYEAQERREDAKAASGRAWALKRAFAPLRHAYALTAHKSQGSTFDTAVVDLADLSKMRSAFQFNRALYVAATRPSQHLAIVA